MQVITFHASIIEITIKLSKDEAKQKTSQLNRRRILAMK
jgi:hypothetical protein